MQLLFLKFKKNLAVLMLTFVDNKPVINDWKSLSDLPAKTEVSDAISKDLKKRGMSFVGSTIIYAFMQAVGMVDDHQIDCFKRENPL